MVRVFGCSYRVGIEVADSLVVASLVRNYCSDYSILEMPCSVGAFVICILYITVRRNIYVGKVGMYVWKWR